ncbi:ATP-dependent RecD-like DNA helicase [Streptomyces sp. YIM 130001]|uniref:helix-hairpin-helix domain-containing protein n=1 Tax=Streptomyces sp. YIM 130001 TaxID=2259644 RepID=UPI000EEDC72A|nr:helix-hairpin-helix domain-containing protein [Streptomyces sp. YIM 130001]RII18801.1 ATP-dependent RecD-like DNA helicase [Streptomyces sp. YIM 130001]
MSTESTASTASTAADEAASPAGVPDGADAPDGSAPDAAGGTEETEENEDGSGTTVTANASDELGEADGAEVAASADAPGENTEATAELSDTEAELAAQRELRERIARRKSEKQAPIEAGTKLSGTAADLLAAVRAVESGEKPAAAFREPPAAPRTPAPAAQEPRPRPAPEPATAPLSEQAVTGVRAVLAAGSAPESLAGQVTRTLGDDAGDRLREDPWLLLRLPSVRPDQADGFARALLGDDCGPDDERRGRALAVWLLEQAALAGHTALDAPALHEALAHRSVPDPDAAVQNAIAEGDVLVFQDALDDPPGTPRPAPAEDGEETEERPVRVLVGLERYAMAEESLADGLARLVNSPVAEDDGTRAGLERAAAGARSSAAELIGAAASHGLVLHSGGESARAEPAALVTAARELGLRAAAAVHGEDGRHRLAATLGDDAVCTVAGLLSGAEGPGRDAEGALALDLLAVLDAPQLDVETAAMLVESLADGTRLVLNGDPGVLASAGPGRVYADLLASRGCPAVVSRTPDPGPLGELVSGIGAGELPAVEAPDKEVVIVPVRDPGEAVHRTVQLVAESVPRAFGIPAEQARVITPVHGGAAGTRALNEALKNRLNPGPGRFGGFDPGDVVAYSPVPGRTHQGRVVRADAAGLHLDCGGRAVVVAPESVEQQVRHGWALTAHQAVGHRWPAAVVVLPGDAAGALTRAWVYTACGRAERHLSVVQGVEQALPKAVAEIPAKPRTTRLTTLLRAQVPAQS